MDTIIYLIDFFKEVGLANAFSFTFIFFLICFAIYYFPSKTRSEKQKVDQEEKNMEFLCKQNELLLNNTNAVENLKDSVSQMSKTFEKIMTKLSVQEATDNSNSQQIISLAKDNINVGNKILEKNMIAKCDLEHLDVDIKKVKDELEEIHDCLIEIKAKIKFK